MKVESTGSTVSVAMATYNGESHLAAQLESIARQVWLPRELVVCDDGSTDSTLDVLTTFARTAPFEVRVFRNEMRLGWQRNFAKAASKCNGDYIAFCDQDDIWHPEKTERSVVALREMCASALLHRSPTFQGTPTVTPIAKRAIPRVLSSLAPYIEHCDGHQLVIRQELKSWFSLQPLFRDPLFDAVIAHDRLMVLAAVVTGTAVFLDEPLTFFRRGDRSVTGLRAPLRRKRSTATDYARHAEVLANWIEILEIHGPRMKETENRMTARVVGLLERLQHSYEARARLYVARAASARVPCIAKMLVSGAYRVRSAGGLGLRSLTKDIPVALGVLC